MGQSRRGNGGRERQVDGVPGWSDRASECVRLLIAACAFCVRIVQFYSNSVVQEIARTLHVIAVPDLLMRHLELTSHLRSEIQCQDAALVKANERVAYIA